MMFNFSLLLCLSRKVKLDCEDLDSLKQRCLALLTEYVADRFKFESSKPIKSSNASGLLETSSMTNQQTRSNYLGTLMQKCCKTRTIEERTGQEGLYS